MGKLEEYLKLFKSDYDSAVETLLHKYGKVPDSYFHEDSFNSYKLGLNKTIKKGNISKTSHGLYVHHVLEDRYIKLSTPETNRFFDIPFYAHLPENLVYCDIVEHAILHVLITRKVTEKPLEDKRIRAGSGGYLNYLSVTIYSWYFEENKPSRKWEQNCFEKAYLTKEESNELLTMLDHYLVENTYVSRYDIIESISKRKGLI